LASAITKLYDRSAEDGEKGQASERWYEITRVAQDMENSFKTDPVIASRHGFSRHLYPEQGRPLIHVLRLLASEASSNPGHRSAGITFRNAGTWRKTGIGLASYLASPSTTAARNLARKEVRGYRAFPR
jgi:hypothetical protein